MVHPFPVCSVDVPAFAALFLRVPIANQVDAFECRNDFFIVGHDDDRDADCNEFHLHGRERPAIDCEPQMDEL
jgi:hypothetical protein